MSCLCPDHGSEQPVRAQCPMPNAQCPMPNSRSVMLTHGLVLLAINTVGIIVKFLFVESQLITSVSDGAASLSVVSQNQIPTKTKRYTCD